MFFNCDLAITEIELTDSNIIAECGFIREIFVSQYP